MKFTPLNLALDRIHRGELKGDYAARNWSIVIAMAEAQRQLIPIGFAYDNQPDPEFDGFRIVAYIELPTGQVSWHLPEHPTPWDGHSTEEKYDRIRRFIGDES